MSPRSLAALFLLLLLLAPNAAATHPQAPTLVQAPVRWYGEARAAVSAEPAGSVDSGLAESSERIALVEIGRLAFHEAAIATAAYRSIADYLNATATAPKGNGSQEWRRAYREHHEARVASIAVEAHAELATTRAAFAAFQPRTASGLEWGIMAGRLVAHADYTLDVFLPERKTQLRNLTQFGEPDVNLTGTRIVLLRHLQAAAVPLYLAREAREVLLLAKEADATGLPLVPSALEREVALRLESASFPPAFPTLNLSAERAEEAMRDGGLVYGLAYFLFYDETRVSFRTQSRAQSELGPGVSVAGLAASHRAAVEAALNETVSLGPQGLPGILLRDAAAYGGSVMGTEPIRAIARFESSGGLHNLLVIATTPPSPDGPQVSVAVIVAGAALLAVGAAWIAFRRR